MNKSWACQRLNLHVQNITFASAYEYIVVLHKVHEWQIKSQYKNISYNYRSSIVLFFSMGKNTSEWDREVCSTMRGVVSQVTLAAWSNITILQECFWGDKHSLWFNCTTEAYTEKCLHMISNSSVSLPGLDNCYQKTLPSNKSKTPLLHKSFGTTQTHFELLWRYL